MKMTPLQRNRRRAQHEKKEGKVNYPFVKLRLADQEYGYFNSLTVASVRRRDDRTTILNDQWLREQMIFEPIEVVAEKLGIISEKSA